MAEPHFNGQLQLCNHKEIPDYITPEEITEITYAFLEEHGYPLQTSLRKLSIYFLNETRYDSDGLNRLLPKFFKGYTAGIAQSSYLSAASVIKLYIPHLRNRRSFIETLLHELDHVLWALEHKGIFDRSRRYYWRPHEMRARKTSRRWYGKAKTIADTVRRLNKEH